MNKQQLLEIRKAEPFEVGEEVHVSIPYIGRAGVFEGSGKKKKWVWRDEPKTFTSSGTILEVGDRVKVKTVNNFPSEIPTEKYQEAWVDKEFVNHELRFIGEDPFAKKDWSRGMSLYNKDIDSLLSTIGWDRRERVYKSDTYGNVQVPRLNWNPVVGDDIPYQRDFCWGIKEKQLLIESIYQGLDIGKIVLRYRSYNYILSRIEKGLPVAEFDLVDGKQRCKAIIDFVSGVFPDLHGNYWDDLSLHAQYRFMSFRHISYGELDMGATDEDVLSV